MKKADKSVAAVAIIIGEDEVAEKTMGIKYLREDKPQISLPLLQGIEKLATDFEQQSTDVSHA
jgi:histidyl-tRNA synthetase